MAKTLSKSDAKVFYIEDTPLIIPYYKESDGRKSPLGWIKFRTPAPITERIDELRRQQPLYNQKREAIKTLKNGFAILGVYDEILRMYAGNRSKALRGWIVNHLYRPATPQQIAQSIGCYDLPLVRSAMEALESEELIFQTALPDLETADKNDKVIIPAGRLPPQLPRGENEFSSDHPSQSDTATGEADHVNHSGMSSGSIQNEPGGLETLSLGRKTEDVQTEDGRRQTEDDPPPAADGSGKPLQENKTDAATPQTVPTRTDGRTEADGQDADGTPTAESIDVPHVDATDGQDDDAEPREPTKADAGQGGPPMADMSWHSEDFAHQVLDVLYPTREDLVLQGRLVKSGAQGPDEFHDRELGCFRRMFERALPGLGQVQAMRLLQGSIKLARRSHKVKCRNTRGMYLCGCFGNLVSSVRGKVGSGPP
jgi:hypothetical protein